MSQRLIGIISTMILARLLTPNDFGVIAIIALTVHLADILSDAGSQQYIIQKQDTDDNDINTAWTLDIISKFFLTVIIILLAPFIAETLDNPLLTHAIQIVSLSIPLRALRSPGLIIFAKEFEYGKLFKLSLYQKLISFSAVMLVVFIKPSYWAIVIGDIVSALTLLIGSYKISHYRPSLTLVKFKDQWGFSKWSLLRGITGFLRSQADMLIVSKAFPAGTLGSYHLQRELALIPAISLIIPAMEPLLSAVSKAKHDHNLLIYRMRLSILTLLSFLLPLSCFIYVYSEDITYVLLGEQWVAYHQLLSFFSLMFFAFCLHALVSDFFTALNQMRTLFIFDLLSTLFILGILLLAIDASILNFSLIRGVAGLAITVSLIIMLNKIVSLKLMYLLCSLIPIVFASMGAISASIWFNSLMLIDLHPLLSLILISALFFSLYILMFYFFTKIYCWLMRDNMQLNIESSELLRILDEQLSKLKFSYRK